MLDVLRARLVRIGICLTLNRGRAAKAACLLTSAISLIPSVAPAFSRTLEDAPRDGQHGTLRGRVTAAGLPVQFANVVVLGTRTGVQSDETGSFFLNEVPTGKVTLRVMALGFSPATRVILVKSGDNAPLGIQLERLVPKPWRHRYWPCDVQFTPGRDSVRVKQIPLVDTAGWQMVEGSVFDFPLPTSFHRPNQQGHGIDSEVGTWEDSIRHVSYDLGEYTAHTQWAEGMATRLEMIDGVQARIAAFQRADPPRYHVEAYFCEVGLGLSGSSSREADVAVLLTAFRALWFHEPRPRTDRK